MKSYPSIEYWNKGLFDEQCYGFDKLDGSNIRAEWDRKTSKKSHFTNGFKKFGTRTQMLDDRNPVFGEACHIIMDKYSNDLDKMFREEAFFRGIDVITCFFEYFGPNSFAGWHDPNDKKDVVLFDALLYKKGFVTPKDFIRQFENIDTPRLIYSGLYSLEIVTEIRENVLGLNEGAVFKGVRKTKGQDIVWMVKVKTNEWLLKVKQKLGQEGLIKELNGDMSLVNSL